MSRALCVCHGAFGRATIYELDRALTRHAHREAHLLFHVGGAQGYVPIGHEVHRLGFGAAVAVNPWELHGYAPTPGDRTGGCFLILYLNPDWLRSVLPKALLKRRLFAPPRFELTHRLAVLRDDICHLLYAECSDPALLEARLAALVEAVGDDVPVQAECVLGPIADWSRLDFRLRKSIGALSAHRPAAASLLSVARSSGLSRAHFFKLFREQIGLTPVVYTNVLRIETALDRIVRGDAPIAAISDDLGFSCQSAFSRFFASHVGMAPTDYRRAARIMEPALHALNRTIGHGLSTRRG